MMPKPNGTSETNDTNGVKSTTHVDSLLGNLMQTVCAFKTGKQERDRLAALKAAQELVRALHEPRDNVYHLVYSVLASTSHLTWLMVV
jgi:hypothetical protein